MRYLLKMFLFSLLLSGCIDKKTSFSELEKIDSLIQQQSLAAAELQLKSLNSSHMSEEERAYYFLLLTEFYKEMDYAGISDSLINISIAHYERISDKKKLIRAYCLRSHFLYNAGKSSEVILQLKKAEELAEKLKDDKMFIQVYSYLYFYNLYFNNMNMALSYAQKTKKHADLLGDKRWIGFANQNLFILYYELNIPDSINYYIKASLPYAKYQPLRNRPLFYNNIAVYYLENKELEKAQSYLSQSLSIYPHAHTYYLLAKIYSLNGELKKAEDLWDKALQEKETDVYYIDILEEYADWLKQQGRHQEASEISARSIILRDSLLSRQHAEQLLDIQYHYNQDLVEKRLWKYILYLFTTLMFLFPIVLLLWKKHKNKVKHMEEEISNVHSQLSYYEQELETLGSNNQIHQQEITELQNKIEVLRTKYKDLILKGSRLYERIVNGGDMKKWNRDDMSCFIEFYQSKDFTISALLGNKYKTLSIHQKLFLILQDMNIDEKEIKRIMHLSDGAFRTMFSRLNKKLKELKE